ncbi:MAG: PEPxxWA-CTERM sorting domain-containing protein [Alphaproteobacteria bacterium]|nr:PEPxxWA-CTERM sorting domain-containing protein [Alphaproteobacteria bacterium]MBU1512821.1 PEPxxWA-CTERM sorting domain-containing protein [Alphaproteobacteria bacterium]MBU2095743.1 PEPxxWA-CTERM sorting domain-containing protein [Alphaproteobacteria bacterium]MBU2153199.1 PEPxxWA-CTERM sorting domain-containing protein [Alphaproteobacteria bacterium]MBU2308989.1 PEPxxWA-CTERM sorting domain-containing protein [Alphaproteobacteria bacterium]
MPPQLGIDEMNNMSSLKMAACAVAAWAALAAPSFAATFSNNWSFVDTDTGATVGGVISGLVDGDNLSADGLTITVTQSPYDVMLGDYTFDFSAGAGYPSNQDTYSASNSVVTFANFIYANEMGEFLTFGTHPTGGSFYPQLISYNTGEWAYNMTAGVQFSAVTAAEPAGVPEPATWAIMIGGLGLVGARMRRRRGTTAAAA